MARKSRKNVDNVIETVSSPYKYNAAAYVRLSSDDKKKRGDSLETQRNIIENYVAANSGIRIVEVYSDNNTTGTNFDRPGFQRMLADAHVGRINCIIVKDLSRFGRNAIDGGYYIEKLLPSIGVRFIAITDSFDSNDPESGIMLPIRQIINESYALDIGRKRRAVQVQQIAQGLHLGRVAPYGYMKAPGDYHKLIINEETAPTVRKIFEWAHNRVSSHEIARRLSEDKTQTPAYYNHAKGYDKSESLLGIPYWKVSTVNSILSDEVYVGDMVQGKSRTINGKHRNTDPSEWVRVPDTHEPIISREFFTDVQVLRQEARDKAMAIKRSSHPPSIFTGTIICAHCGRPMKRKYQKKYDKSGGTYWFRCESQQKYGKDACGIVSIPEETVCHEIMDTLRRQSADVLGKYLKLDRESVAASCPDSEIEVELRNINRELGNAGRYHKSLFESLVDGLITPEEHAQMKCEYEQKIKALSERADEIRQQRCTLESKKTQFYGIADAVSLAVSESKLTAEIVTAVVDKVLVRQGMNFEVLYRFDNDVEEVA